MKRIKIHFFYTHRLIITIIFLILACTKKDALQNDAQKFDKIARTLFKEVYPLLAMQVLQDYGISQGVCLDIGCGPAYFSIEIAKQSLLQVIGVDIDPDAIPIAQANVHEAGLDDRITIEKGDVQQLKFQDEQFDLIISRGSFLYWQDQVQALREIYRVLKPGGAAFIGGGMSRYITKEKKAEIKTKLAATGFQKKCSLLITPQVMSENLLKAGVEKYALFGDGPGESGFQCGMWVEIRKEK